MNTPKTPEQLDAALGALTEWSGGETDVWRDALQQKPTRAAAFRIRPGIAAVVIVGLGVLIGVIALDPRGQGRVTPVGSQDVFLKVPAKQGSRPAPGLLLESPPESVASLYDIDEGGLAMNSQNEPNPSSSGASGMRGRRQPTAPTPGRLRADDSPRQVIRTATIDLEVDDVRAVFQKTVMLLSEARGEYIEASEMRGRGDDAAGHLKLRVAVDRLSTVLNEIRELGVVVSEELGGDDVTAKAVDLEARLSNELRVEQELLELLSSRKDDRLEDILELRERIGYIRERIEQLTAQQNRLSRLVSLATILVTIRPAEIEEPEPEVEEAEPEAEEKPGLGAYFMTTVGEGWRNGLTALTNFIGGFLHIFVGGLAWWALLALIAWFVRQRVVRAAAVSGGV